MSVIPCEQNKELRTKIKELAETLKTQSHKLDTHGLGEEEFYNSGLFRGAIERIRGQFSASMREKREFVQHVLNYMQDKGQFHVGELAGAYGGGGHPGAAGFRCPKPVWEIQT